MSIKAEYIGPTVVQREITAKQWKDDGINNPEGEDLSKDFMWPAYVPQGTPRSKDVTDEPESFIEYLRNDPEFLLHYKEDVPETSADEPLPLDGELGGEG